MEGNKQVEDSFHDRLIQISGNKKTLQWESIIDAYKEHFPAKYHDLTHDTNSEIMDLLQDLEKRELLTFPVGKEHWDRTREPNIPLWIRLILPEKEEKQMPWKTMMWHPLVSNFAKAGNISDQSFQDMLAINQFIKKTGDGEPKLPIKERSLMLLEDEKQLEKILNSGWGSFLTLDMLHCYKTWEPITFIHLDSNNKDSAIIVENRDTFHSIWRVCRNLESESPYEFVIYGKGKLIVDSIPGIHDVSKDISIIEYFGDIDSYGFQIPFDAQEKLREEKIPVKIVACEWGYRALIDRHKKTGIATNAKKGNTGWREGIEKFLPNNLVNYIKKIIEDDSRIPQELVNYKVLKEILENNRY